MSSRGIRIAFMDVVDWMHINELKLLLIHDPEATAFGVIHEKSFGFLVNTLDHNSDI